MIDDFLGIFRCIKLWSYKYVFCNVKEKIGSLTATEAFSADVINIMNEPTVTEFADFIGISQPNATYKINCLVSKGYIEKNVNPTDRREVRLKIGDKFSTYYKDDTSLLSNAIDNVKNKFSKAELDTAQRVINEIYNEMNKQISGGKQ